MQHKLLFDSSMEDGAAGCSSAASCLSAFLLMQGPSPDEVALVECARTMGFEFVRRTGTHTILNILGQEVQYETLEVMEFSSERQRMSVIVRAPDGTIKICCKGVYGKDRVIALCLNTDQSTMCAKAGTIGVSGAKCPHGFISWFRSVTWIGLCRCRCDDVEAHKLQHQS